MYNAPELLRFASGEAVTAETWPKRREEMLKILSENLYGITPAFNGDVVGTVFKTETECCSGHAVLEHINISFEGELGRCIFPIAFYVPNDGKKHPLFIMLNFTGDLYYRFFPPEEIIDNGFALAVINYSQVTSDSHALDGIATCYSRRNDGTDWGKIGMWAFAASRTLDYMLTRKEVDPDRVAVAGHSRLGKTALWCAAQDPRFHLACSNDSGCFGASFTRVPSERRETPAKITTSFPYWFCKNAAMQAGEPDKLPFDQHFLLACIAPRYVVVGSASRDYWACPMGEQTSCIQASPAWELLGKPGFLGKEEPYGPGESNQEGYIGYHMRHGVHFFGRADWQFYMDFLKNKLY